MITIQNNTPFYIKIFETTGAGTALGNLANLLEPYAKHHLSTLAGQHFAATLSIDRSFRIKDFDTSKNITIDHKDFKSLAPFSDFTPPTGPILWSGKNAQIHEIDEHGTEAPTGIPISENKYFLGAKARKTYVLRASQADNSIIGYFVTGLPVLRDPNDDTSWEFNHAVLPDPRDPNNIKTVPGGHKVKAQTWFIPNFISGFTDASGNHSISTGPPKGRISNDGKGLRLFTNEVAIYEYPNYNGGQSNGRFWIISTDSNNLDAFFKTTMNDDGNIDSQQQSVKMGPGTMAVLYSAPNHSGAKQEIGGNCAKANFHVKSLEILNIEAASSAGLNTHTEVAEQYHPKGTYYRTTVVRNGYAPKNSTPSPNATLKPGLAQKLYIESSTPVTAIVNGKSVSLKPFTTGQTPTVVDFNMMGQVEILIKANNNSIRVPNLFIYTDKMDSEMRVMIDPNTKVHKRLAEGKIKMGKFSKEKDLKKAGHDGTLGDVDKDHWDKVADFTTKTNQAVVKSSRHDAAGLHVQTNLDASHMQGFQDTVIHFGDGKVSTMESGTGKYKEYVANNVKDKPIKPFPKQMQHSLLRTSSYNQGTIALDDIGDIWDDVTSIGITIGHAIDEGIEDAIHIIAEIGDAFYHMALSAIDEIAKALKKIYDAVKLAIEKLIEFIKFLIAMFEGVRHTCATIHNTLTSAIDAIAGKITDLDVDSITQKISDMINAITGMSNTGHSNPHQGGSGSDFDSAIEKINWLINLITKGLSPSTIQPPDSLPVLQKIEDDVVSVFLKLLEDTLKAIESLAKDPDNVSGNFLDLLQKIAGDVENGLTGVVGDVLTEFKNNTEAFKSILEEELDLPSPIQDAINAIMGVISGEKCSPIGIISLLVGFPTTIIYFIMEGEAPYSDNKGNLWPSGLLTSQETIMTSSDHSTLVLGDSDTDKTVILICSIINDFLAIFVSPLMIVNAKIDKPKGKELALLLGCIKLLDGIITTIFCIKSSVNLSNTKTIFRDILVSASLLRGAWGVFGGIWNKTSSSKINNLPRINCVIDTILGLSKVAYGVVLVSYSTTNEDTENGSIAIGQGAGLVCELDGITDATEPIDIVVGALSAACPLGTAIARIVFISK